MRGLERGWWSDGARRPGSARGCCGSAASADASVAWGSLAEWLVARSPLGALYPLQPRCTHNLRSCSLMSSFLSHSWSASSNVTRDTKASPFSWHWHTSLPFITLIVRTTREIWSRPPVAYPQSAYTQCCIVSIMSLVLDPPCVRPLASPRGRRHAHIHALVNINAIFSHLLAASFHGHEYPCF